MTLNLTWFRPALAVACIGVAAGCSSIAGDLAGGLEGVDGEPRPGLWSYLDEGFIDNTCGTEELYRDPDTVFTLVGGDDGTFIVQQGDPYGDFECTVRGDKFTCPERLTTNQAVSDTNATVFSHVSVNGWLEGSEVMWGEQVVEISCEGGDCALAPSVLNTTFPCSYTVSFSAQYAG